MTTGADRRSSGYSVSSACPLLQTHTHTTHTQILHLCTHSYALSHYFMTHLLCMAPLPHLPSLSVLDKSEMALREDVARRVGTLKRTEVEASGFQAWRFVPRLWAWRFMTEPFTISAPSDLWQPGDGGSQGPRDFWLLFCCFPGILYEWIHFSSSRHGEKRDWERSSDVNTSTLDIGL